MPVKVSCPVSHIHTQAAGPPSVCCSTYGITVKVHGQFTAELLRVNGKHNSQMSVFLLAFTSLWFLTLPPFHYSQRRMDPFDWVGWAVWLQSGQTRSRSCYRGSVLYMWHYSKGKFQTRLIMMHFPHSKFIPTSWKLFHLIQVFLFCELPHRLSSVTFRVASAFFL